MRLAPRSLALLASLGSVACVAAGSSADAPQPGKEDSGWVAEDSYELEGVLHGTVTRPATGDWAELATSLERQTVLIDSQLRFAKNRMARDGYHVNQLSDGFVVDDIKTEGDRVTLSYRATVDMVHALRGTVPALAELPSTRFQVALPKDPVDVLTRVEQRCAEKDDGFVSEYNYYYYFAPDKSGCDLEMVQADLEFTKIFPRKTAYPEYDRLLVDLGDGTHGFHVAIVPDSGDDDPYYRFNVHKSMLEDSLKLTGTPDEANGRTRYEWRRADLKIVIDLYDPTVGLLADRFRKALGSYEFVLFNGHSLYGTRDLLTNPGSYARGYQIIMMHSCRSFEYYSRQVFRAKATPEDPRGWDSADVIASGESNFPADSPRTLEVALRGLMDGIDAVANKRPAEAPSWQAIAQGMNEITFDILYGAVGVRENHWQPTP